MVRSLAPFFRTNAVHPDDVHESQFVIALARGLSVLKAFEPGDDVLTNSEIANRTRLPKATITRITYTLGRLGYLSRNPEGAGYRLDPHTLTLGFPVLARLGVRQLARPILQVLAEQEKVTIAMGLRDGTHMIMVERIRPSSPVVLQQDIGTRIPIALTALGRGYIAALAGGERAALLDELRATSLPDVWPTVREGIEVELERYRGRGYCYGGAWDPRFTGVAVPLSLPGRTLLAVACTGSREDLPEARLATIGERLKDIVRRLALAQDPNL